MTRREQIKKEIDEISDDYLETLVVIHRTQQEIMDEIAAIYAASDKVLAKIQVLL